MALLASSALLSVPTSQVKQFKRQPSYLHGRSLSLVHHQMSHRCCMQIRMAQFGEENKVKEQLKIIRNSLWETIPSSLKDFPWQKAEEKVLERLSLFGQKALKWSIVILFIISSLSDVVFSISRNQELMIPFGLLIGCLMADFLKETGRELFQSSEVKVLNRNLVAVGGLFLVIKFMSTYFVLQTRVFLLHVANGALMQVLWLWRNSLEANAGD